MIDPKSIAGVLLREHDNPQQAFDYATRKARYLMAMHYASAMDFAQAADQIAAEHLTNPIPLVINTDTRACTCHPDDSPPTPCPRKFALDECRASSTRES